MKNKVFKLKLIIMIIFLIGSVINGIFITIYNVDRSANMVVTTSEIDKYKFENMIIKEKIIINNSLTIFSENADKYGFKLASKIIYLDQAEAVAQVR